MAKTDALQGSLDLLVLKILSRRPRLHGYAIMAAIASTSGEVLRAEEGSLYPALYRMEEAGWIRAEWIKKDTGRRARVYELTAAGKKQLGAEESRWQSVSFAINRALREGRQLVVVAYLECLPQRASEARDRGRITVAHRRVHRRRPRPARSTDRLRFD